MKMAAQNQQADAQRGYLRPYFTLDNLS